MEDLLYVFCNHQQNDWADWLPVMQYIINSRPSSTTKKAPHQAMHITNVPSILKRREALLKAREDALQAMDSAQNQWVKLTNYEPYKVGDCVWLKGTNLHTTHSTKKLCPKHFGPFII